MYRVLVVDDEQLAREGMTRLLGRVPQVEVAAAMEDGLQAREYLDNHTVDAVFSDIRMPAMDGLALAKHLAVCKPDCQMVLVSAYCDFAYAQKAMACGVKHYLMKPVRQPEIRKMVEELLSERNQREKRLLWNRNLKQEIQEAELYRTLISEKYPAEAKLKKRLYYARYEVLLHVEEYEKIKEDGELLSVGFGNIFRWCAPQCITVLEGEENRKYSYILLAENREQLPKTIALEQRVESLMEVNAVVRQISSGDAKELVNCQVAHMVQEQVTDEVIARVREYVETNLSRNISRTDVAEAVHLEPTYFSKFFKKKYGINFQDYLLQERMKRVMLLLGKGYKVWDAALEAGFSDRNYFNRVFRKYAGCSPSEYKRKSYTAL